MLPAELIQAILEFAYFKSPPWSREPDCPTLVSCSLVNSLWRDPAQALLWRHIQRAQMPKFLNLLESTETQALFHHVRIIEVDIEGSAQPFQLIVERCINLYELTVHFKGFLSIPMDIKPRCSIRCLRLAACPIQSKILYNLISMFPGIRFLTIGVEIMAWPPKEKRQNILKGLHELILHRTLPDHVLAWVLDGVQGPLRALELRDPPSDSTKTVLAKHLPDLHSVRLMRLSPLTAASSVPFACTSLRELVLLNVPTRVFLKHTLPSSLEHLGIINQGYTTSVPWWVIAIIIGDAVRLPNLRVISCDKDSTTLQGFEQVEQVCSTRSIQVLKYDNKRWPTYDPVPVSTVPRSHSVSNFRLMN